MTPKRLLAAVYSRCFRSAELERWAYVRRGRRPWSLGYVPYKEKYIKGHLADPVVLGELRNSGRLPAGYGEFLDERVVEYPWLLSRVRPGAGRLLDAGSALNHDFILSHEVLKGKQITILTLAPENQAFWRGGVSYVYADMREMPFRDDWFDEVVSVSTIEHVGKDNTKLYTPDPRFQENTGADYLQAVRELRRVCRPGGRTLITVPYGRFQDFGWYQQFDAALVRRLIDEFAPAECQVTYYRYHGGGWQLSSPAECAECEGFDIHATRYMNPQSDRDYDPDYAAASRAVAALELTKSGSA